MRLPFKGLYIFTQDFGANPQNYAQFLVLYPDGVRRPMKGHNGLDFGCPTRTEIIAPHDGKVIEATFDQPGYGLYVKIENDVEGSVIAHLDKIDVQLDFQLKEGDHIGWSDNTGNSTGPHCHWGYYRLPRDRSNGFAGFIDQKPFLEKAGIHLTVGQLPEIDTVELTPDIVATDTGTTYKGIDLSNSDSVKATIDAWYDVAHGKYKTADEYQQAETQLGTVKQQLEDTQKADANVASDLKNYTEMKALGYNTVNDIIKALAAKDNTNLDLQKENATLRKRNSGLATMVSDIETEDHTTAELGEKAISENSAYKDAFVKLMQVTGVEKLSVNTIIDKVSFFKTQTDKFITHLEGEQPQIKIQPKKSVHIFLSSTLAQQAEQSGEDILLQLFNLRKLGKGVK